MSQSLLAYMHRGESRRTTRLGDATLLSMDDDRGQDTPADERHILGLIVGCCNENPRDEEMLAVLVEQLKLVQARRTVGYVRA